MSDFSDTFIAVAVPYAICFFLNLLLSALVLATQAESCQPNNAAVPEEGLWQDGVCGYDQALFLVLTTFHAGSWGHVVPATSQRFFICLVASLGYLWPLATLLMLLTRLHQFTLRRLAATTLAFAYIALALFGSLVLAALVMATTTSPDMQYSDCLYYVWMIFHLRAYGEIIPQGPGASAFSLLAVMAGSMCWVLPLLMVAQRTVLDPGALLFSSEGGFKAWLSKAAFAVAMPYMICFTLVLLLAAIYFGVQDPRACEPGETTEGCEFGEGFRMLLATFHGATLGHIHPMTEGQRLVACIVASMGYLWRQVVLVLLLVFLKQSKIAKTYAKALCISYAALAGLGCLIFAALNFAASEEGGSSCWSPWWKEEAADCSYIHSWYYTWMAYHGRSYGEISSRIDNIGESIVAVLIVMTGNMGWVYPLLVVVRASVLHAVVNTVRPVEGPTPTEIQIVGAQQD